MSALPKITQQPGFYIDPESPFVHDLKSISYKQKESGQTADFSNLSALAPHSPEMLNIWQDFKKVVEFIDANHYWLRALMAVCLKKG